jgi:uncharacterized membrane protein
MVCCLSIFTASLLHGAAAATSSSAARSLLQQASNNGTDAIEDRIYQVGMMCSSNCNAFLLRHLHGMVPW